MPIIFPVSHPKTMLNGKKLPKFSLDQPLPSLTVGMVMRSWG